MSYIASWFNDRTQAKYVNLIVEDTHAQLKQEDLILNKYFTIKEYDDRNFLGLIVEKIRPIASVVAYGSNNVPATKQGTLRQAVSQLSKLALDYIFTEEDQWKLQDAMRMGKATGVTIQDRVMPDGTVIKGTSQTLADYLFSRPEDLVIGIHNLMRLFAWQVACTGEINYADPRTGSETKVDWKEAGASYNHFPAALSNTGGAADPATVIWTDYANANGIYTLENAVIQFTETNGYPPAAVAMSNIALRNLMRQEKVVDLARQTLAYSSTSGLSVSMPIINRLLEDRMCPPIVVYDQRYDSEDNNGVTSKNRFLPTNRYVMLTEGMGERAFGATIESKQSVYDQPKPGIYVNTKENPLNASEDLISARATGLAIALNPKLLYSQQVFA